MKTVIQFLLILFFTLIHSTLYAQVNLLWSPNERITEVYEFGTDKVIYYAVEGSNVLEFYNASDFSLTYSITTDPPSYLIYPSYIIPDMNSNGHNEIIIETPDANFNHSTKIVDLESGTIIYEWAEAGVGLRLEGPYQSTNSNELRVNVYKVVNMVYSDWRVYSLGVSATRVENLENGNQVSTFHLNQNYPNPFNSSTVIEYNVNTPGTVSIKIYDIGGNLIGEIDKTHNQSGNYRINWDGTNENGVKVSSGTYFYSLESGDFTTAKKMILLK
jgi:hypothetical protein